MNKVSRRMRRFIASLLVMLAVIGSGLYYQTAQTPPSAPPTRTVSGSTQKATDALETLAIKGRAPKTGYSRDQFGNGWADWKTCNTRERILARDLQEIVFVANTCKVQSGTLHDPYTGKTITFKRGATSSQAVQIDHVVALSDAWQKGAQLLSPEEREAFANDDLNLLAVDGPANQQKGAGDAATWLPKNKPFRCQYIARQIAVKSVYKLWITQAEHLAMRNVLAGCPDQLLPSP